MFGTLRQTWFSAALCRGLIEAAPRQGGANAAHPFSAALCRGLIEAPRARTTRTGTATGFPRLYAAASLKRAGLAPGRQLVQHVFRGFMPRPH